MKKMIKILKAIISILSIAFIAWCFISWMNVAFNNSSPETVKNIWEWNLFVVTLP